MAVLRVLLLAGPVLLLLGLLPALPQAEAAVAWQKVDDPDYPGTCLVEELGQQRVPEGHTWQLNYCGEGSCTRDATHGMVIRFATCGLIGAPEGCTVERDQFKAYPDCCGTIVCPDGGD